MIQTTAKTKKAVITIQTATTTNVTTIRIRIKGTKTTTKRIVKRKTNKQERPPQQESKQKQ